jgi:methionyl-tRNA formyltransferase
VRPLKIIFAGSGEFGLPTSRALLDAGHDIVQVVTQPDRPAGRGRTLTPTPIAAFAASRNLPLLKTDNINTETLPPADAMIVIAFGQKIGESIVHHPRLGSVNLHASILPKYRGAAPINWAIINGERVTGNSIIRLAQRMDAGDVLAQSTLEIAELETAGDLHDRLSIDGAALMTQYLADPLDPDLVEMPQDESRATLAPKLSRELSRIDWNRPDATVANHIRGMYPWPGCRVRLLDESGVQVALMTLSRARPASAGWRRREPGTINDDGAISVAEGGAVEVVELQPEGKKPMYLTAFRNGHRWDANMRVESVG